MVRLRADIYRSFYAMKTVRDALNRINERNENAFTVQPTHKASPSQVPTNMFHLRQILLVVFPSSPCGDQVEEKHLSSLNFLF